MKKLKPVLDYYDKCPDVVAIVISWKLFGERGFPWDYKFSEKALDAFNKYGSTNFIG